MIILTGVSDTLIREHKITNSKFTQTIVQNKIVKMLMTHR
jgi:hypothetical protein